MAENKLNDLHKAAQSGDLRRVEQLLHSGVFDVNACTENFFRQTALHYAAKNGNADGAVVARLIQAGADINARDVYRQTPLMLAAWRRAVAAVEVLLAAGADVHPKDQSGRRALHYAARYDGDVGIVGQLLAAGAQVDAVDDSGCTPLFHACQWSRTDVIAALLQAGTQMNKTDRNGRTPLFWAATGYGSQAAVAATTACLVNAGAERKTGNVILSEREAMTLVEAGYRKWEHMPARCPGLKASVLFVWQRHPEDLRHLFSRLSNTTKKRIRSTLLSLHRYVPELEEKLRMEIVQKALR